MISDRSRGQSTTVEPTAAAVLRDLLDDQVAAARALDGALRDDDPEGLHRTRVALHRLRSTLRTTRPILEGFVDPIVDELKWFSRELGPAHDAYVQRARLTESDISGAPPAPEIRAALGPHLLARQRAGTARVESAWLSERHATMLTDLGRLYASDLITPAGELLATHVHAPLVAKDLRRIRRRADEFERGTDPDHLVNELRKATSRARYASAVLVPSIAKPAVRLGQHLQRLQDVLDERHDSFVARRLLSDILEADGLNGSSERVVRQLLTVEEARTGELDVRVAPLVRKALQRGRFLGG